MRNRLALVSLSSDDVTSGQLSNLAAMMGVDAEVINLDEPHNLAELLPQLRTKGYEVIALDNAAAAKIRQALKPDNSDSLFDGFRAALIYGFENDDDHVVGWLSEGALTAGKRISNAPLSIAQSSKLARQMAGLSFSGSCHPFQVARSHGNSNYHRRRRTTLLLSREFRRMPHLPARARWRYRRRRGGASGAIA
ncbi:MAG: hypothetical protein ACREQ4_07255 [Candidatus Binataceae bacterium]